jgi:hypothetical protein
MQLEKLLSAADPARKARIDDADSPLAAALYQRIVATSPSRGGGREATTAPRRADPGSAGGRRVPRRNALAATAAASAVVAAAIGSFALAGGLRGPQQMGIGGGNPSASPQSSASPGSSASPRSSASPHESFPVSLRLNQASTVLGTLAAAAAATTSATSLVPGPGKYLYVLDIELKGSPSVSCDSLIRQEWLASDSSGRQVGYSPGCTGKYARFTQSWPRGGNGIYFDYFAWKGLPTTPAAMEAAIVRRFEGGKANNAVTFLIATSVLNVAEPSAVRAAVFRMLATLPGLHYLGKVTDPLGRTGDAIGLVQEPDDLVAMFDRRTGQVLDALLVPYTNHLARRLPPFDFTEMYAETGIVGSVKATPPGTEKLLKDIPYRHWVS